MKLVTIRSGADLRPGLVVREMAVDLTGVDNGSHHWRSLRHILERGELDAVRKLDDILQEFDDERLLGQGAVPLSKAQLAAPIPQPGLIIAMGRTYGGHVKEMMGTKSANPSKQNGFLKSPYTVIGPGDTILRPRSHPDKVDFEGEIAVIIGKPCFQVSVDRAMDHVAGFTLINDVSARDWNAPRGQAQDWDLIRLGKQFPTFCPMGPALVTTDEIDDASAIELRTELNGVTMQHASTSDLLFSIAEMIAFCTQWYELRPGDVLSSGTPEGVGLSRDPQVFMKDGDVVAVSAVGLGKLANTVASA